MLLVQKPPSFILSSPAAYSHRRHPSAPVVVQPNRTPGLLTLSKPSKPASVRQPPSQQRREPKAAPPKVVRASTLTPPAEIKLPVAPALPPTPSPQSRGRTPAKQSKDKAQRSVSHSSVRAKHGRQTPPQIPSQAEAPQTTLSDPFLDRLTPPPSPVLASKPTGKLARRRQNLTTPPLPLSKAIPVPIVRPTHHSSLSRSEPVPSRIRFVPQRSSTFHEFPVCDDMTEVAENDYSSPPSTPRRPTTNFSGSGVAPLSARNLGGFPFNTMEHPSPLAAKRGSRKHKRVPSEGVFNMSSDEDVSSGPGGTVLNANVQALFGLVNFDKRSSSFSPVTPPARAATMGSVRVREPSPSYGSLSNESRLEREAFEKAGYFASSMFQNSPSPEELPDLLTL